MLKEEAVRPGPSPQAHRRMCWLPGHQAAGYQETGLFPAWNGLLAGGVCVPGQDRPFHDMLPEPSLPLVSSLPGKLTKS